MSPSVTSTKLAVVVMGGALMSGRIERVGPMEHDQLRVAVSLQCSTVFQHIAAAFLSSFGIFLLLVRSFSEIDICAL